MQKPIVSICCITYNHAPFIRQCLDGFLMQQPPSCVPPDAEMSDWCEILIHDDASTDGTADIIREYERQHPDIIKPLYETVNQYSHGKAGQMDEYNYRRIQGKYVAYCEGDDYWTDPQKLLKQIDFMEAHPDYSVCFHCFRNHIVASDTYKESEPASFLIRTKQPDGADIDMDTYFSGWLTQPLTMVFRVSMYDFSNRRRFRHFRDMHEIFFLLKAGKCRLMPFDGGVRNVHQGGVASMISHKKYCDISLPMVREFFWKTLNKYAWRNYIATLEACIRAYRNTDKSKALRCALTRFLISGHPGLLKNHIKEIYCSPRK